MDLGAKANLEFSDNAPWKVIKEDKAQCHELLVPTLWQLMFLGTHLAPFLPDLSDKLLAQLGDLAQTKDLLYKGDYEKVLAPWSQSRPLVVNEVPMLVPKLDEALLAEKMKAWEAKA